LGTQNARILIDRDFNNPGLGWKPDLSLSIATIPLNLWKVRSTPLRVSLILVIASKL
jgi:hypothetical protein